MAKWAISQYICRVLIGLAGIMTIITSLPAVRAEDLDRGESPYMEIVQGDVESFPLASTDVKVSITEGIAHVIVEQHYQNRGKAPIEVLYVFPASTRAAIHRLMLKVGERTIEADVREKEEARTKYEQARQSGTTAALLEQERPNVFSVNIANILPSEDVRVVLEYTERVQVTDGIYAFVYPTVVGPRYVNKSAPLSRWMTNPFLSEGTSDPTRFHMDVVITSPLPIARATSPSHQIQAKFTGKTEGHLEITDASAANRDFILEYELQGAAIESGVSLHRGDIENFFLLAVEPPARVPRSEIVPREFIFIVDVSGSMDGFPLEVSKSLINDLLGELRTTEAFNIVLFAGSNSTMSKTSLPATSENIQQARSFMAAQNAGGGTELLPALRTAMSLERSEGVSRSFIILTDGYVTVEPQIFSLIGDKLGDANFFPFGIGTSVNRFLIEGIARASRAESFVVTTQHDAHAQAKRFMEMVSAPVMTDIAVSFDGFQASDLEPGNIPDLLARRPVTVVGKWKGEPRGRIIVTGKTASGPFRQEIDVAAAKSEVSVALPFLWARDRIARLSDFAGLQSDAQTIAAVVKLGLQYNLVTNFTSFVAIDSITGRTLQLPISVQQPLPLPMGVTSTATSNFWHGSGGPMGSGISGTKYNDAKIANSTNAILTYIEGSFGALFMLVTGLFAIVFSITWATTRKRPHGVLAIVFSILAVLAFLIRNLTQCLFNDLNIQD